MTDRTTAHARQLLAALAAAEPDSLTAADAEAAWGAVRDLLRARTGDAALDGGALVAAARTAGRIAIAQAHAFIDLHGAATTGDASQLPAVAAKALVALTAPAPDAAAATADADTSVRFASASTAADARGATGAAGRAADAAAGAVPADARARFAPALDAPPITPTDPAPSRVSSGRIVLFAALAILVIVAGAYFTQRARGGTDRELEATLTDGIAALEAGNREVARDVFTIADSLAPADARALVYLGRMAREDGDGVEARRLLEQAVRRDPQLALAQRELGSALLADGEYDLARRFYVRAIALDPDDRLAQGWLGCALTRLERAEEAATWFDRAGDGPWRVCRDTAP